MMNYRDTEALTIRAVTNYYHGDMSFFYNVLHPKTIMLSVGEGQLVEGKAEIMDKFREDSPPSISYELSDIVCMARRMGNSTCFTLMSCKIMTLFPDGALKPVNQRITVIWKYIKQNMIKTEKVSKEGWYALHIHISVAQELKREPENFAHVSEAVLAQKMATHREEKIRIKDVNACVYYIPYSQIAYFRADNYHVIAHCLNRKEITFRKKISSLEEEIGEKFIRISRKYLVNSTYITKVSNYKLYLTDDTIFPIPSENYQSMKNRINKLIMERNNL